MVYLICGLFSFFILRALGELCYTALPVAVLSLMPVSFWVRSRLCCRLDVLHQLGDDGDCHITAVALYMHYWGAFGGVPQGSLRSLR